MLRKYIANGYQPADSHLVPLTCVWRTSQGAWLRTALGLTNGFPGTRQCGGLALVCPTCVTRATLSEHAGIVSMFVEQLEDVGREFPDLPLTLVLGMQWLSADEEAALSRLEYLGGMVTGRSQIPFIGISLPGPGKVRTLNAALRIARDWKLKGLAWMDDDVYVTPHSLAALVRRLLEKGWRGAVGTRKLAVVKGNASRLLFKLKKHTAPACDYPHGCCILVETGILGHGFPDRYIDDGYVCFELLDPSLPNPLEHLEIVSKALCYHYVGGSGRSTLQRIRATLFHHQVFLAGYPKRTASYYFSQILFYGLWPLAPWHGKDGMVSGCVRWLLKLIYFLWFGKLGFELLLRGVFHCPLRQIGWGDSTGLTAVERSQLKDKAMREAASRGPSDPYTRP